MTDTGWIERAGGTVTRDAGGQPVAVDLRAGWTTDSDMPLLAQMSLSDAVRMVAQDLGVPRGRVYDLALVLKRHEPK